MVVTKWTSLHGKTAVITGIRPLFEHFLTGMTLHCLQHAFSLNGPPCGHFTQIIMWSYLLVPDWHQCEKFNCTEKNIIWPASLSTCTDILHQISNKWPPVDFI